MVAELLDDLRRLVADADKAGEGWTSYVCGRAIIEIERLKLLIRCETIEPPSDVTDDCTTELAVELAQAKAEIELLKNELTDMEDCKEALRQLGRYCGCDHCESSDERRVQVRHIKEAFAKRLTEIKRLQSELLFVAAESEKQDDEIERLRSELSQRNTDAKSTTLQPDTRTD